MELIKVVVERNIVRIDEKPEIITSGTVGLPVEFSFDSDWDGLTKIAAFVAGDVKKIVKIEAETTVPWEVLQRPGVWFGIGVYGMNEDGTIVIPAIYANVSIIRAGTDLDGDEEMSPTPQVLSQFVREYLEEFPPNDGFSPSVDVSETSGGHKVSITDKDGVNTFYVTNGRNGKDGYTPVKNKDYFDGKDGYTPRKGVDYFDGKDGYTPIKGVDYTDGENGYTPVKNKDYFDGRDGISATHSWSGTVLTITSASGTTSVDLKGETGSQGPVGPAGSPGKDGANGKDGSPGKNGSDGRNGVDGKTPVKGTDYFTAADKAEMVSAVISALPKYNGEVVSV